MVLGLQWLSTIFMTLSFVAKIFVYPLRYKKHREKEILCKQGYNFCDSSANVLKFYDIFEAFSCMRFKYKYTKIMFRSDLWLFFFLTRFHLNVLTII